MEKYADLTALTLVILVALVAAQAVDDAEQVISAFYRLSRVVCGSSLAGGATGL